MDEKVAEYIKESWDSWKNSSPWYCPKCDCFLNGAFFQSCAGGYHPYKGVPGNCKTHKEIKPKKFLSFEEFANILYNQMFNT